MLREAAYGLHLPSARAALHGSVVEILESILTPAEQENVAGELADHCRISAQADPIFHERELHWLGVHGKNARRQGQPQEALDAYRRIAEHKHTAPEARLKARLSVAELLSYVGHESDAMEALGQLAVDAEKAGMDVLQADALSSWAPLLLARGHIEESLEALQQALAINRHLGRRKAEVAVLSRMSTHARHIGDPERCEALGKEAFELQSEEHDPEAKAQTLLTLVYAQVPQQKYAEAEAALDEAESIATALGKRHLLAQVLVARGSLAGSRGDWADSEKQMRRAVELCRETGAHSEAGGLLDQLGGSLRMQGRFEEAEPYHQQAMEILEEIGDHSRLGVAAMNYAGLCKRLGRMEEAGELYLRSLKHVDRSRDVRLRGHGRGNYAEFLHKQGRLEESRAMFVQSLELLGQSGDIAIRAIQQGRFAALLIRMGRTDEGADAIRESMKVLSKSGGDYGIAMIRQAIGEVCTELGLELPAELSDA